MSLQNQNVLPIISSPPPSAVKFNSGKKKQKVMQLPPKQVTSMSSIPMHMPINGIYQSGGALYSTLSGARIDETLKSPVNYTNPGAGVNGGGAPAAAGFILDSRQQLLHKINMKVNEALQDQRTAHNNAINNAINALAPAVNVHKLPLPQNGRNSAATLQIFPRYNAILVLILAFLQLELCLKHGYSNKQQGIQFHLSMAPKQCHLL